MSTLSAPSDVRTMQVKDADNAELSSSPMSSAPASPPNNSDTIHVARPANSSAANLLGGVVTSASSPQPRAVLNTAAHAKNSTTSSSVTGNGISKPEKPKKQRRKPEVLQDEHGKPVEKPKKPRKPREPKDKAANGTTTAAPRKKVKTEPKVEDNGPHDSRSQARQTTIAEMVGFQQPSLPASISVSSQHQQSEGVKRDSLPPPPAINPVSNSPTPRPVSSGQNYDPIRGVATEYRPHVNMASASPSIASLLGPTPHIKDAASLRSPMPQTSAPQSGELPNGQALSPPPPKLNFPSVMAAPPQLQPPSPPQGTVPPVLSSLDGAMDVDPSIPVPHRQVPAVKAPSNPSSTSAPTPKAARPTPEALKGTGSGLLSTSDLFGGPSSTEPTERKGVNIDIHIPLNPAGGNTINIAQEIIKKYGREAINPRAAAHREQLLRLAEQQDKLGGTSNDESVDLMSDLEGDSNIEMGGMDDEKSNTGVDADGKRPVKRRKKVEEYDKEDDFIDDTELAWQENAAVASGGFFVYNGLLATKEDEEKAESATKSRGGRGRGRGSRGGRTAASGTTHASLAEKKPEPTATTTTTAARGRGSRGGRGSGAPRKPRITKADKEKMDLEKADRERSAAVINGTSNLATNAMVAPTSTPPAVRLAVPAQHSSPVQALGTMA